MKAKRTWLIGAALAAVAVMGFGAPAMAVGVDELIVPVYRTYNPNDGKHFFTGSIDELEELAAKGWISEPIACYTLEESNTPVERLYNPYTHEHHYTTDANEVRALAGLGWRDEGVAWMSGGADPVDVYRLYNRYASASTAHHYTTSAHERDVLVARGWTDEGVGWQAAASGEIEPMKPGEDGYHGFQNPAGFFQVSCKSVDIPHLGDPTFGYRTESRIAPDATREDCIETAIARAYEYLDTPYVWGQTNAPGVGIDCSGLVIQALYATGMDLDPFTPWLHYASTKLHTTDFMRNTAGFQRVSFNERQRGDLIFYEGHVAIYLGNDQIIEATPPRVRISSVYKRPVIAVRRPFVEG